MDWIPKQPEAEYCPWLQFLLHGQSQRILGGRQVQVAIINVGIDQDSLPTKQGFVTWLRKARSFCIKNTEHETFNKRL